MMVGNSRAVVVANLTRDKMHNVAKENVTVMEEQFGKGTWKQDMPHD